MCRLEPCKNGFRCSIIHFQTLEKTGRQRFFQRGFTLVPFGKCPLQFDGLQVRQSTPAYDLRDGTGVQVRSSSDRLQSFRSDQPNGSQSAGIIRLTDLPDVRDQEHFFPVLERTVVEEIDQISLKIFTPFHPVQLDEIIAIHIVQQTVPDHFQFLPLHGIFFQISHHHDQIPLRHTLSNIHTADGITDFIFNLFSIIVLKQLNRVLEKELSHNLISYQLTIYDRNDEDCE